MVDEKKILNKVKSLIKQYEGVITLKKEKEEKENKKKDSKK